MAEEGVPSLNFAVMTNGSASTSPAPSPKPNSFPGSIEYVGFLISVHVGAWLAGGVVFELPPVVALAPVVGVPDVVGDVTVLT